MFWLLEPIISVPIYCKFIYFKRINTKIPSVKIQLCVVRWFQKFVLNLEYSFVAWDVSTNFYCFPSLSNFVIKRRTKSKTTSSDAPSWDATSASCFSRWSYASCCWSSLCQSTPRRWSCQKSGRAFPGPLCTSLPFTPTSCWLSGLTSKLIVLFSVYATSSSSINY